MIYVIFFFMVFCTLITMGILYLLYIQLNILRNHKKSPTKYKLDQSKAVLAGITSGACVLIMDEIMGLFIDFVMNFSGFDTSSIFSYFISFYSVILFIIFLFSLLFFLIFFLYNQILYEKNE